jgi:hypothetical protein
MNDKPIVITVYLRKGGTGKSTLVALLGRYLAATGFRVVIIDLDRQGSQSALFDLVDETGRGGENLHLVLKRRVDILAARLPVPFPALAGGERGELYLVPGGPQTAEAIEDIADNPVKYKTPSALDIVRGPIEQLTGHADFVRHRRQIGLEDLQLLATSLGLDEIPFLGIDDLADQHLDRLPDSPRGHLFTALSEHDEIVVRTDIGNAEAARPAQSDTDDAFQPEQRLGQLPYLFQLHTTSESIPCASAKASHPPASKCESACIIRSQLASSAINLSIKPWACNRRAPLSTSSETERHASIEKCAPDSFNKRSINSTTSSFSSSFDSGP